MKGDFDVFILDFFNFRFILNHNFESFMILYFNYFNTNMSKFRLIFMYYHDTILIFTNIFIINFIETVKKNSRKEIVRIFMKNNMVHRLKLYKKKKIG